MTFFCTLSVAETGSTYLNLKRERVPSPLLTSRVRPGTGMRADGRMSVDGEMRSPFLRVIILLSSETARSISRRRSGNGMVREDSISEPSKVKTALPPAGRGVKLPSDAIKSPAATAAVTPNGSAAGARRTIGAISL